MSMGSPAPFKDEATGAIHRSAVDHTNAAVAYASAVNGGTWKTTNALSAIVAAAAPIQRATNTDSLLMEARVPDTLWVQAADRDDRLDRHCDLALTADIDGKSFVDPDCKRVICRVAAI